MKKIHIYQLMLIFSAAVLGSCTAEEENLPEGSELVPITVQLPGVYNAISEKGAASRASKNNDLNNIPILNLEQGSTLWLFAKEGSNTTIQGYVVKTSDGGGVQSLYPCGKITNSDGTIEIDENNVSTTPLYLETNKTYTFKAISPALKIYNNNKFKIVNGQYAVATNDAWTQTQATTITISGKEGIVVLNPLMQIGARMTFTIKKSARIASLSVIQSGIEVDGIGKDPDTAEYSIGDNMVSDIGDSYNRLFVAASSFVETGDYLKSEIGIVPVDCRATEVYVIVNLMVNGTPVQYTFAVKDRLFKPGYSYDYTVNIDIKDGITIANWQENSWSTEVYPD